MKTFKNENNEIVLVVDSKILYYAREHREDLDEDINVIEYSDKILDSFYTVKIKEFEYNGEVKLMTIIDFLEELGQIINRQYIIEQLLKYNENFKKLIDSYYKLEAILEKRILIYQQEGSGRTDGWLDKLYININDKTFDLESVREVYWSPSDFLEYEFKDDIWDRLNVKYESIYQCVGSIKSGIELKKSIVEIFKNDEQWRHSSIERNEWNEIIKSLKGNDSTKILGLELVKIL
jgi:hypothetical protein